MRCQLLAQRGGRLALGALVGTLADRLGAGRLLAGAEIHQPAGVIVEIAVELLHAALGHQQELVGGALEQMAVVGDHQHRAFELLQGHGQRQAHFQVQVVGGFVKQQQVGSLPGDQRQGQTGLFATGEVDHRLVTTVAAEVEATEKIAQRLLAFVAGDALQVQQRTGLGVQGVQLVLGEVADRQVLAALQAAAQRLQLAGQGLDQRRLAGAVGTEQTDTRTRHQLQLDLVQHRPLAIAEAAFGQVQQRAGNLEGFAEAEIERRIHMRRGQLFQALQRLEAALRLAGLGRLGLEAADEVFHVRALRLLLVVGLLLLGQTLDAGALEGGITAPVLGELLLFDVDDLLDHRIEEVAVVGNQQQGARVAFQPAFQPEDRIEVQVVGGLVEQQQVGRAHQRLRQVEAHAPATGEVADPAFHLRRLETQPGQQLARAGVGAVAVGVVQFGVQARLGGAVVGRLGGGQLALDTAQLDIAIKHIVHRQTLEVVDLLAHVGDAPAGWQLAFAAIGTQFAAQQGEQAGLAGAIGADQTGLLTGMQGEVGLVQQTLRTTL